VPAPPSVSSPEAPAVASAPEAPAKPEEKPAPATASTASSPAVNPDALDIPAMPSNVNPGYLQDIPTLSSKKPAA
jgi:cell division septation protein DedD